MPNHYPEHFFSWIVLRIVIWHIVLEMEKLSEIKSPLQVKFALNIVRSTLFLSFKMVFRYVVHRETKKDWLKIVVYCLERFEPDRVMYIRLKYISLDTIISYTKIHWVLSLLAWHVQGQHL